MRIDRLELRNFKKFATFELNLHPQFTLLIGDNGAGKTSVLDALAVALGIWLVEPPDSTLIGCRRGIYRSEIRLRRQPRGEREQFRKAIGGVSVKATGQIEDHDHLTWERLIEQAKKSTRNYAAKEALAVIEAAYERARTDERVQLPVIAYYGAGRAWLHHNERRKTRGDLNIPGGRWAAFYDCLNERIRIADLEDWFQREANAAANRGGQFGPGFEVVRTAVLRCVAGADRMWFDGDREEIVLSVEGRARFSAI